MNKIILSALFFITPLTFSAQRVMTVDNELFLGLVVSLLSEGNTATIIAKGNSMRPFIGNGEKIRLEKSEHYEVGDIVLAHLPVKKYVLHRIISYTDTIVTLMGDGNLVGKEYCNPDSLKAVCKLRYDDKGNMIHLDSDCFKSREELWQRCISQREEYLSLYSSKKENVFWEDIFRAFITSETRAVLSIRPTFDLIKLNNESVLFSRESENFDYSSILRLNSSAEFLFSRMKGKVFSLNDVVNLISDEYKVDNKTATQDCMNLLTQWFTYGVIKIQ